MYIRSRLIHRSLLTVCVSLLMACAPPPTTSKGLALTDTWIRQAPPGATMLAAYGTLHNRSAQTVEIVHVNSDHFDSVTFHETTHTDGVARMRMLPSVVLKPESSLSFVPGGLHIMLMGPTATVVTGDHINIHFTLKDGTRESAEFVVKKP